MKGWCFTATNEPLQLLDIDEPVPGPGEVLLDVKAAGLCHSDVGVMTDPIWMDRIGFTPLILGHEIAGVVSALGPGVDGVKIGDRVGVCPSVGVGTPGFQRHGGFTSKFAAKVVELVSVPDHLSLDLAALGTDAGMTAYHAMVSRGRVEAGMKVGVIGFGGLGQIGARVAVVRGAEAHVAEPNEAAWPAARAAGAADIVPDASAWAGKGFDLIVDYAGFDTTTRAAVKAVRRHGRVVLVGMAKLEFTLDTMPVILSEIEFLGSAGGTPQDIAEVYELLAAGHITPTVTVIDFLDIAKGLDDLQHHRITGRLVSRPS
ncbi:MAG: zinc-binding dehydrogenase [Ilumatobacteraceae bacterium]|nr:zinc-binding dehydrogenase [Ilumatobacteraceae bacterium]